MTWLVIAAAFVLGVLSALAVVWAIVTYELLRAWDPPERPDRQIHQGQKK